MAQLIGTVTGVGIAVIGGLIVYGIICSTLGIRLSEEQKLKGADLSIHKIRANPEVLERPGTARRCLPPVVVKGVL